jgi:hypothetical protein
MKTITFLFVPLFFVVQGLQAQCNAVSNTAELQTCFNGSSPVAITLDASFTLTANVTMGNNKVYNISTAGFDVTLGSTFNFTGGNGSTQINVILPSTSTVGLPNNNGGGLNIPSLNASNSSFLAYVGALPLVFSKFEVRSTNGYAELLWQTQFETKTNYFVVERSRDGQNFNPIGQVKTLGEGVKLSTYKFTDENLAVLNYYRLQLVDLDSKVQYSPVVVASNGDIKKPFQLYPTVVQNGEMLYLQADGSVESIDIFNAFGQIVTSKNQGSNSLDVSELPKGFYLVCLKIDGLRYAQKIVKN